MKVLSTLNPDWDPENFKSFDRRVFPFLEAFATALKIRSGEFEVYKPRIRIFDKKYISDFEAALDDADFFFHSGRMIDRLSDSPLSHVLEYVVRKGGFRDRSHDFRPVNKLAFATRLRAAGIPVPHTRTIDDFLKEENPGPVIIKPRSGTNGRDVYYVPWPGLVEQIFRDEDSPLKLKEKKFLVQDFVYSGNIPAHYRVFVAGHHVIGCVLSTQYYPIFPIFETGEMSGDYDKIGLIKEVNVTSNSARGALQIPVSHPIVFENVSESRALIEHLLGQQGLNAGETGTPIDIDYLSKWTSRELRDLGLRFAGLDMARDATTGELYVYDFNSMPGFRIFRTLFLGNDATSEDVRRYAAGTIVDALMDS